MPAGQWFLSAVFFCSDDSAFISGQNLIIDGGQVMI